MSLYAIEDAVARQMFIESLHACGDPSKRRAADEIERLALERTKLLQAAKQYMAMCPADEDLTFEFQRATNSLRAAIAKAEGK